MAIDAWRGAVPTNFGTLWRYFCEDINTLRGVIYIYISTYGDIYDIWSHYHDYTHLQLQPHPKYNVKPPRQLSLFLIRPRLSMIYGRYIELANRRCEPISPRRGALERANYGQLL